jgi:hypothetical protein
MNRNETKLLVENWRKVLDEGLYDSDPELLLTEGFLQDFSSNLGSKLTTGIQALGLLAALHGSAHGLPKKGVYDKLLDKVAAQTAVSYGIPKDKFNKIKIKYADKFEDVAEDEILSALDKLHSTAMRKFDFDSIEKLNRIINKEIKPLIKTKTIKDTDGNKIKDINYIESSDFDKIAEKYPGLFELAAEVASDVPRLADPLHQGEGAGIIKNTEYNKKY